MTVVPRQWCQLQPGARVIGRDGKTYVLIRRDGQMTCLMLEDPPYAQWNLYLNPAAYVPTILQPDARAAAIEILSRYFTLQRIR